MSNLYSLVWTPLEDNPDKLTAASVLFSNDTLTGYTKIKCHSSSRQPIEEGKVQRGATRCTVIDNGKPWAQFGAGGIVEYALTYKVISF